MKNVLLLGAFFYAVFLNAQEYQFKGSVDGRPATLLLHFVTASDDQAIFWSQGSFYFDDEEIANVVYQYNPTTPQQDTLMFDIIPVNLPRLDYIKGHISEEGFNGVYSIKGKVKPLSLKKTTIQKLLINNYYKVDEDAYGSELKYFGKTIIQNTPKALNTVVASLENSNGSKSPKAYLEHYYEGILSDFKAKNPNINWLNNLSLFPIIMDDNQIVYKVNYHFNEGGKTKTSNTHFINYDLKSGKIITASDLFQAGKESEIASIINQQVHQDMGLSIDAPLVDQYYGKYPLTVNSMPYTEDFYITKKGIMFYYTAFVDSHGNLYGPYEVLVSKDKLASVLK